MPSKLATRASKKATLPPLVYPPRRLTRVARGVLRSLQRNTWMRPYQASAALDAYAQVQDERIRIRAELLVEGARAVAVLWVRYGRTRVDRVAAALHRVGYAREGFDLFKRRLHGLAALTREAKRFEDLARDGSFDSWPTRSAKPVETIPHGLPYSPVVSALARRIVRSPWTPIVVAASIQRRRGPISVAWTYVLDDPDADWLEIGLQLRDDRPAAKRVMDELTKAGFRDGLGNVAGGIEGIWAMPRRGFRDLATWRAALRRVRKLMR